MSYYNIVERIQKLKRQITNYTCIHRAAFFYSWAGHKTDCGARNKNHLRWSSSFFVDTTIITDDMRQILASLSYTANEINIMKPNIASTVIQFKLRRPSNGMPKNWGIASEEEEEDTYNGEEKGGCAARKLKRYQVQKIVKRIILSSAGIACSVLLLQKSFRSATPAEEDVSTFSSPEELDNDDTFMEQQLEENSNVSENRNAILYYTKEDETWFDQLITLVAKKLQNLFRRVNY